MKAIPMAVCFAAKGATAPAQVPPPAPLAPPAGEIPPPAPLPSVTETTTKKPRVEPVIIGVSSAVPMPTIGKKRGSKPMYDFDLLTSVGMSLAIKNKKAADISAIVSSANRKAMVQKTNEDGTKVFKMTDVKDAAGNVVGSTPTAEPVMEATKHFFAHDCDPATDPDGASVRIFRDK